MPSPQRTHAQLTLEQVFCILYFMPNAHFTPDPLTKLTRMGNVTLFELAGDMPQTEAAATSVGRYQSRSLAECISHVSTPQGKKPILKTMLTTACERNCFYCPFRAGRSKTRRFTLTPDDLAKAFMALHQGKAVDGLFLSSGIINGSVATQDKLIDAVEIIRRKYGYRGYIHLKIMPGAQADQLYRAMQLSDRISVNLEGPTQARLSALAPKKDFNQELLSLLGLAEQIRRAHPEEKLARTVTQFVVGAVGDTDLELLSLTNGLFRQLGLTRAYYSAFRPVVQTPLENVLPTDPIRQFRLYQSSFLLRDYGWEIEDLPFGADGHLPTDIDPKQAWAEEHLLEQPVDLSTAGRADLLRVPGIGPKGAAAIIKARQQGKLTDLSDLHKLGIAAPEKSAAYVLIDGRRPVRQARLF
ncbi:MAG: putative DNA modification/repair radical SAM protein [Anaerolineae bacterium]